MKATEQYFPVVVFIMLYKVVVPLWSKDEMLIKNGSIQVKASNGNLLRCCVLSTSHLLEPDT